MSELPVLGAYLNDGLAALSEPAEFVLIDDFAHHNPHQTTCEPCHWIGVGKSQDEVDAKLVEHCKTAEHQDAVLRWITA